MATFFHSAFHSIKSRLLPMCFHLAATLCLWLAIPITVVSGPTYPEHSVLSQGKWYKIGITTSGIYKITYQDLLSLGLSPEEIANGRPAIFGNGGKMLPSKTKEVLYSDPVENSIFVSDEDGVFGLNDYILFYAEGPDTWNFNVQKQSFEHEINSYSTTSYYFLTFDPTRSLGKRISLSSETISAPDITVHTFPEHIAHEQELKNPMYSGSQWVGEELSAGNPRLNIPITLPGLVSNKPAKIEVRFVCRNTERSTQINTHINHQTIDRCSLPRVSTNGNTYGEKRLIQTTLTLADNTPTLSMETDLSGSAKAWFDYLWINYERHLALSQNSLSFRHTEHRGSGKIVRFNIQAGSYRLAHLWKISDICNVEELPTHYDANQNIFWFADSIMTMPEYVIWSGSNFPTPQLIGKISNQNLHGLPQTDYVIVAPSGLLTEAERLASLHRTHTGLHVTVVKEKEVYNEFSSGKKDFLAFRSLMKMFYDRAKTTSMPPQYFLFFGDGSFDNKNILEKHENLLPTFQTKESLSKATSLSSDDMIAMLEETSLGTLSDSLCIGLGRLPVNNLSQAKDMVDKIEAYLTRSDLSNSSQHLKGGSWRNTVTFACDDADEPGEVYFMHYSEHMANIVKTELPAINIEKIYTDAYPQSSTTLGNFYPDATNALNKRMQEGALFVAYVGHGSPNNLSSERLVTANDIATWKNNFAMPLFFGSTCSYGRWDNPQQTSSGEHISLLPQGGAIACVLPSREIYSNDRFNRYYTRAILNHIPSERMSFGAALSTAKNNLKNQGLASYILLGDPALKIAFPKGSVVTTAINNIPITHETQDTLRALSEVILSGEIHNENQEKDEHFNGTLYITIYDKASQTTSLGNDGNERIPFTQQNSTIYEGKCKIQNGHFTHSLTIPKDIAYNFGKGKISYYAQSDHTDAAGFFDNIIVGGLNPNSNIAASYPEVKLYLNNEHFHNGGTTDENPVLLATIFDSLGINTSGSGFGHNILAVLDGKETFTLNNYYTIDAQKEGVGYVRYPLSHLMEGKHTLTIRVWNIFNFSACDTITFEVINGQKTVFRNLKNYPNPFVEETSFIIEHNQPQDVIFAQIDIYTQSGAWVCTLTPPILENSYTIGPVTWNGTSQNGVKAAPGIYIYRVSLKTKQGEEIQQQQKLIILPR